MGTRVITTYRDYQYYVDRIKVLRLWAVMNFYDRVCVDAVGFPVEFTNRLTIHHIYINGKSKYVGLIPLTHVLHNYIDTYLLWHDLEEYERWNLFFKKIHDYINGIDKNITVKELIAERKTLIDRIVNDKKSRTLHKSERILKYIEDENNSLYYVDYLRKLKPFHNQIYDNRNFVIYPWSLDKFEELRLQDKRRIDQVEISKALYNYVIRVADGCRLKHLDVEKIITTKLEEPNQKKFMKLDTNKAAQRYLKAHRELLRYDWMKNIIPPKGTISNKYLLTEQSKNILLYLHEKNRYLFDLWEDLLNKCRKANSFDEEILLMIDLLRRLTFEFINEEINHTNDGQLLNQLKQIKMNLMLNPDSLRAFDDPDVNINLCYRVVNDFVRWDEYHETQAKLREINKKYGLDKDTNKEPINFKINLKGEIYERKFNNDYMGNNFTQVAESGYLEYYFFYPSSVRLFQFIKEHDNDLYLRWKAFFAFLNKEQEAFKNSEECKKLLLIKVHNKIKQLRSITLKLLLKETNDHKDIVDMLKNDHIRFYLACIDDIYDSDKVEKMISVESSLASHQNASYNKRIKAAINGNLNNSEIKLNKDKRFDRLVSKGLNNDWMGFKLDISDIEEYNEADELSERLFLTDQSKEIILFIKNRYKYLYRKLMDLLDRVPVDNPNNKPFGYDVNMDNLLYEIYCKINKHRDEFNDSQEDAFIRLRNVVYK